MPLDSLLELLGSGQWIAVVGLFDPLTALQASRLAQFGRRDRKLLAVVLDVNDTLLSPDARASLLAALREIHFVAIAEPERWRSAIPDTAGIDIVEDPEGERARSAEFVEFILNRHSVASPTGREN